MDGRSKSLGFAQNCRSAARGGARQMWNAKSKTKRAAEIAPDIEGEIEERS